MPSELTPIFALIDCNSFYTSVEKIFRPDLRGRAVVCLSNCDGAIIARTNEAKALGIKMGDPYFKVRAFLEEHNVAVFSSNYSLYGEMSARFYKAVESIADRTENYSIDEVFASLTGMPEPVSDIGRAIQARVLQWTALPVGVGIGHTKTLAKAAQHASKVWREKTGGVVDLRRPEAVEWLLRRMPVDEVWGIGRRMREHLAEDGITTAWELSKSNPRVMGRRYNLLLERTIRELNGESCLDLEQASASKQSICSSKMFGKRVQTLSGLREAVATYVHRAAEKLRRQGSLCGAMRIGIQTSFHGDTPKYANAASCVLDYPTDDVRQLTKHAMRALEKIHREGYAYSKAEVLLMDLRHKGEFTLDLFATNQSERSDALMRTMDIINNRWGHDCLRSAVVPRTPDWGMRRALLSPSYMSNWDQLLQVQC
ncbi:Y-family DNA polymerase [Pseudomonas sp. RP23018S]|uniref:Y-family DNA polymerase n=1 Tax=Pseudomonas sp. RP23018S TaxID=3096037 RepID=UPI002ACAD92C|nr:Y-family DNA polymerase [Pseudomonas sp. RP23018S]MDZ5605189.1 Y-family DNA polymerase [Pseudomonas sp. RP23018S]